MTRVHLVHGFADNDGKLTTDRLRPFFEKEGFEVLEFDTGFRLSVTWRNKSWAQSLAKEVAPRSVGIGHSNGCAILAEASKQKADFSQLVFLNPALDRNASVGPTVQRVHVFYSPADVGLRIARFFPWHEWGDMGAVGYRGRDPRFINYNKSARGIPEDFRSVRHLDMFSDERLEFWGPRIVELVKGFELRV